MCPIDSKPTPDDRHACVIWVSRAGSVMGPDRRPIEAEPSPASLVAEVAEKHLTALLTDLRAALPGATSPRRLPFSARRPRRSRPSSRPVWMS